MNCLNTKKLITLIAISFTSVLPTFATDLNPTPSRIIPTGYRSLEFSNIPQIDVNLFGAEVRYGRFVTRTKVLSSNLIFDNSVLMSYNTLIQGPLILATNFNAYPEPADLAIITLLNLLNGEAGFNYGLAEFGLRNSINLYFTRRAYHRGGVYLGFGRKVNVSISAFEEDRFNTTKPTFGLGIGLEHRLGNPFFGI